MQHSQALQWQQQGQLIGRHRHITVPAIQLQPAKACQRGHTPQHSNRAHPPAMHAQLLQPSQLAQETDSNGLRRAVVPEGQPAQCWQGRQVPEGLGLWDGSSDPDILQVLQACHRLNPRDLAPRRRPMGFSTVPNREAAEVVAKPQC